MYLQQLLQLGLDTMDINELATSDDTIGYYVDKLRHTGQQQHVKWLQRLLLEICYIRLGGFALSNTYPEEPVSLTHVCKCCVEELSVIHTGVFYIHLRTLLFTVLQL